MNPARDQRPGSGQTPAGTWAAIGAAIGCVGAAVVVIALSFVF